MSPLAQQFFAMPQEQKRRVHLYFADIALRQWKGFVASGLVPLSYQETVAGTIQEVDQDLPFDALVCVTKCEHPTSISERYSEPICALQDDDWPLPDDAQFAYYAIFNTFKKYALNEAIDDWLIVNQSLSSLGDSSNEMDSVFSAALESAA